jgi:hypothetical protein
MFHFGNSSATGNGQDIALGKSISGREERGGRGGQGVLMQWSLFSVISANIGGLLSFPGGKAA